MAKGDGKKKKARKSGSASKTASADAGAKPRRSKVAKVVAGAKSAAGKISENPLVSEVVAAALVATAAALRNPQQAKRMATDAALELEGAIKDGGTKSSAFWQLALDVARRSIETLEAEATGRKGAKKKSK